ncbi:SGNH/GDSL hydrolase family protein [Streptomyces gamaensis]|uniref:SGNH/GDSL hydrolase family protein n=1 Tax=Streptomyces gamaensis TaxID=1763542 RepID=A0ABW0YW12_9ACTN
MRKSRLAGAVSAAASALALVIALATPGAAAGTTPSYVALGDSYASGVGAGDYDSSSGGCKRSPHAYPALWAAAHSSASFAFTACSGARTGDVVGKQLGPLSAATTLVSLSVGGNDAGFSDTMTTCVLEDDSACLARIDKARDYVTNTLPGRLDQTYSAIAAKAPSARVVVLGYPRFYQLDGDCLAGLSEAKRAAINAAADHLDSVVAQRAGAHGFAYGDVNTTFAGHELCSGDPWLNSVSFPVDESYHPTAAGHSGGYLPVFTSSAS